MRISNLLVIVLIVIVGGSWWGTESALADGPPVQWQKTFGGSSKENGYSVQQTEDGGYIIAGEYLGLQMRDVYLIKTEPNGAMQWEKTFDWQYDDWGSSVQQTTDGGYIIAGGKYISKFECDVYLLKTEPNGNSQWEKTFGAIGGEYGSSVQQTSDGGYIIAGSTESYEPDYGDVYLIKTEPNGAMQWEKTFGGSSKEIGYSVQQTTDGGYIIVGYTASFGTEHGYLIKTEPNGTMQWEKTFEPWRGSSVQQTSDGGYIITGYSDGGGDVYLIKTEPNGSSQWEKTFGGSGTECGYSVQQTSDGGYIIVGSTGSFGAGNYDVYLIKTAPNGSSQWEKTFGGSGYEWGSSVQQTSDGGYIIAGNTYSFGAGSTDVYLIKLCPEGTLSGDLNCDGIVNAKDLDILVSQWLQPRSISYPYADIYGLGDGIVNFNDFAVIASQLLTIDHRVPDDMVYIPGGEFEMGDHFSEGMFDELPIHTVFLDSFFIGKYETTNMQYCDYLNSALLVGDIKVVGEFVYDSNDSGNNYPYCRTHGIDTDSQIDYNDVSKVFTVRTKGDRDMSDDPMIEVSWYGAVAYCNWRSQQEGKEACYNLSAWECDFSKHGYRLPTEAEWEYAARGGNYNPYNRFPWGDTISHSQANYYSSGSQSYDISPTQGYHPAWNDGIIPYTAPVGSFQANGYGVYDVSGNVYEWCNDQYSSTYYSMTPYPHVNPTGPVSYGTYVVRGGTYPLVATYCRVSERWSKYPEFSDRHFGFRIVLDLH
ncbi:MAG: SUMF1/EgtB/PvdO family nonheme iron enzyme [Aliifodinibius sp.]|nr:SUMF1/EgtB/PvdO family nonheme iron enzyme [Fodinibius sp.]NIY24237.1 SUMF1/EgtB/PvdO family nonheme iron enzyme [Fodinibius sp.]